MSANSRQRREKCHKLWKSQADIKVANFDSKVAVIICHPWGPLRGNMDNNVVVSMARYFHTLKITTLRLNFSTRQIGRGYSEVDEVVEAANFLLNHTTTQQTSTNDTTNNAINSSNSSSTPPSFLVLVGYSYGSLISMSASAKIPQVIASISIAPPFGVSHWLLCFNSSYHAKQANKRKNLHRLFLIGDRDNFTSIQTFLQNIKNGTNHNNDDSDSNTSCTDHKIFHNLDHFFFQKETYITDEITQWFLKKFQLQIIQSLKNVDFSSFVTDNSS